MIPAFLLNTTSLEANPLVLKATSALLILLVGFIAGRLLGLGLKNILHQFNVDKHLASTIGYRLSLERQLSIVLSTLVYAAAIIIALQKIGVLRYALLIIGGLLAVFVLISLALSFRDAVPNLLAGMSPAYRNSSKAGDTLTIRTIKGTIIKKGLFVTIIREGEDDVRVPNRLFAREEFKVTKKRN